MPSFDVVSRVDFQEVDNAVNNTLKAVATRYDFRGSKTELTFDRKEKKLHMLAAERMKMDALREMFLQAAVKRGLEVKTFQFDEPTPTSGGALKRDVTIREGIPQDLAKQMVKAIKDSKIKVQASIQGEELRITGKQLDDLQAVMTLLKGQPSEVPLQFVNMKR
ncbi:MAG: YajQ family cyclic di-GMP-binding protein [Phycisphaeraceae bacterium]